MKRFILTLIWGFTLLGVNADIVSSISGSHNMSGKARAAITALPQAEAEDDGESSEGESDNNESESDSDQKESDRESEGEGNATD